MRKRYMIIIVACVFCALLAFCFKSSNTKNNNQEELINVAYVVESLDNNNFFSDQSRYLRNMLKSYNADRYFVNYAFADSRVWDIDEGMYRHDEKIQLESVKKFIYANVDHLIWQPMSDKYITAIIKLCKEYDVSLHLIDVKDDGGYSDLYDKVYFYDLKMDDLYQKQVQMANELIAQNDIKEYIYLGTDNRSITKILDDINAELIEYKEVDERKDACLKQLLIYLDEKAKDRLFICEDDEIAFALVSAFAKLGIKNNQIIACGKLSKTVDMIDSHQIFDSVEYDYVALIDAIIDNIAKDEGIR